MYHTTRTLVHHVRPYWSSYTVLSMHTCILHYIYIYMVTTAVFPNRWFLPLPVRPLNIRSKPTCVYTNKDKIPSEYATLLFKARLFIMPSISTFAEGRPKYCDILDSMTPSSLLLSWRLTNHASSKRPWRKSYHPRAHDWGQYKIRMLMRLKLKSNQESTTRNSSPPKGNALNLLLYQQELPPPHLEQSTRPTYTKQQPPRSSP